MRNTPHRIAHTWAHQAANRDTNKPILKEDELISYVDPHSGFVYIEDTFSGKSVELHPSQAMRFCRWYLGLEVTAPEGPKPRSEWDD